MNNGVELFFSYSHADEGLRNELEKHLSQMKREGLISTWHDRRLLAGSDFDSEIDHHIHSADVILLLVSPDFLNSDYCYLKEMDLALQRHKKGETHVVPIIARPCDWKHSPISNLLAPHDGKPLTTWGDLDSALNSTVQELRRLVMSLLDPR